MNSNFESSKSFSIFHVNIHSIEKHIDTLRCLLKLLKYPFDILAIDETKIQKGKDPNVKLNIEGYQNPESAPTEANKGGVMLYVRKGIDAKPRKDLHIYAPKAIESIFIEIINPNKLCNDIVGVIYRHPTTMKPNDFNENYLKPLMSKLSKKRLQ